ncbi:hypothetical protein FRACYDRAFT_241336 [Fragilariopsis cylindrus CCMP1102]|uniref:Uncharacterized protein n=1 Tax=Fragilariopsis cylindrus CCMP1102 TaxID=635003 RepID=A0A1E7F9C2_9STRA|nr:hypothetical protein FRACYDRAFT_241336 [Fragilariopsis cylindrus CCMP1102]|eukprot:OEU14781.1 hypothetical protein FRACYDRAFT_241336 [Fragilariopsis cylindrus CCMP1102]
MSGYSSSSRSAVVPSPVRALSSLRSSSSSSGSSSGSSSNNNTTTYSNSVQSFKDQEEYSYNEGSVNVRIVDSNTIDTISATATTATATTGFTQETAGSTSSLVDKIVVVLNTNSGGNALGTVVGCSPQQQQQQKQQHVNMTTTTTKRSGRKRKFLKSLFRTPQKRKQDNFKIVLQQLIEATTTTTISSLSLETDIIDLPLIRVRTTKAKKTGVFVNGRNDDNIIDGDNDNNNNDNCDDQYAFFAGVGYDSLLLQDYKDLQEWTKRKKDEKYSNQNLLPRRPRFLTTGVLGYTVAMLTRSIPKLIQLQDPSKLLRDVRITTTKSNIKSTAWIDHRRGDIIRPIEESDSSERSILFNNNNDDDEEEEENADENNNEEEIVLYRGSAGIIAGSTVPYYGGKLKLFPFARLFDTTSMQLRIVRQLHPLEGLSKVLSIFNGSYRDSSSNTFKCLDFVGTTFKIEINESYSTSTSTSTSTSNGSNVQQIEEGFPVQHSERMD